MKCLRTFDSHNQLHTEGLFSRDLRGYKAVLALLRSHSALFSSEMAMNLTCYIPAEPAASHTPSGHRRETMRIHEKKNILSPLAHFVFQHHLIKVFFLLEVASIRTAISHLPSITLLILPTLFSSSSLSLENIPASSLCPISCQPRGSSIFS